MFLPNFGSGDSGVFLTLAHGVYLGSSSLTRSKGMSCNPVTVHHALSCNPVTVSLMAGSPTTRTLKRLRDEGWPAVQVVETWNPHVRQRRDLFGIIDVLAVGPAGVLGVQTTSRGNMSSRRNKMLACEHLVAIREAGMILELDGWDQPGGKGSRWRVKTERV